MMSEKHKDIKLWR